MEINWCYVVAIVLAVLVFFYAAIELHYFLRTCLCAFLARYVKRKSHILDTTSVSGVCLTTDVDTLLYHMNNARYFREMDFARVDFYERTNLYRTILSKGGAVFQGAATIRYRKFIRPFHCFTIDSKIIYWDDQSVFMEHRFLRPSDKFVHAIALCRQRIVNCSADDVMAELLESGPTVAVKGVESAGTASTNLDQAENGQVRLKGKPEPPPEVLKWIEYNELSSKNLRGE